MVVTTDCPFSAHRVSYLHNLFQNGAPTLSGLVEMFHERQRRREINIDEYITFVMITGYGGMDIRMSPKIGTALRNHRMIVLESDNQGYMNNGGQSILQATVDSCFFPVFETEGGITSLNYDPEKTDRKTSIAPFLCSNNQTSV